MYDIDLRDRFALALATGFAARDGYYEERYEEHLGSYSFDEVDCKLIYIIADRLMKARADATAAKSAPTPVGVESSATPAIAPPPVEKEISGDEIRAAVSQLSVKHDLPAVFRLLGRWNATQVSELDPAKYAAILADINKCVDASEPV